MNTLVEAPAPTPSTPTPAAGSTAAPVGIVLKRRTIDSVLISLGIVAAVVFTVAGGLLTWGHNFSADYVHDELSSQHISFPTAEALTEEGRTDLLDYAGQTLDSGDGAEAYASYIDGHLTNVGGGLTYAEMGAPESAAKAAVTAAVDAGEPQATIDELQATATKLTNDRNTMFKGETLRGLLLSAYAWSTVGTIAGLAAIGAFLAAAVTAILVGLGLRHHRRTPKTA